MEHIQNMMSYAAPILDQIHSKVEFCRKEYSKLVDQIETHGSTPLVMVREAVKVLPLSIALFAAYSCLSTPALVLVGITGTAAFLTQSNLLKKEGKLSFVASALSVNVFFTATKVFSALAALDAGAALLAATFGGAASVGLVAGYLWLSGKPEPKRVQEPVQCDLGPTETKIQ